MLKHRRERSVARDWVAASAALFASACQARAPMPLVGTSTSGTVHHEETVNAVPAVPSPAPPDFQATLTKVNRQRFVADGHAGGRFDADVYITPTAKEAAFSFTGKIETGTVLVMEEFEHGKDSSGPLLVMEKTAPAAPGGRGDWRYEVVDGKKVATAFALKACASCHDEAPHDHVFRILE